MQGTVRAWRHSGVVLFILCSLHSVFDVVKASTLEWMVCNAFSLPFSSHLPGEATVER